MQSGGEPMWLQRSQKNENIMFALKQHYHSADEMYEMGEL